MRCPSTFVAGDNKYFQDFEDQKAVEAMGKIISYVSPFCGRHAIINPKFIYKASDKKLGISVTQYGVVRKICILLQILSLNCIRNFPYLENIVFYPLFIRLHFAPFFQVCFAYFGPIKSLLRVNYNFYDKTKLTTESATNYLTIANAAASTKYACFSFFLLPV